MAQDFYPLLVSSLSFRLIIIFLILIKLGCFLKMMFFFVALTFLNTFVVLTFVTSVTILI